MYDLILKIKKMKTKLYYIMAFALFLMYGKAFAQADGTLDDAFNIGTGFNEKVNAIATRGGKILVGGNFTSYNGETQNKIIRLNTDGTHDTTFNTGTGFNDHVYAIAYQPNGKIFVGGEFTSYNGQTRNRIVRLNTNGSLDTTFDIGTGFSGGVETIVVQPDGKIIVGGGFTFFNGELRWRIARLNNDGSLDTTFGIETSFNSYVNTLAIQPDGKIIAGGAFTSYNGQGRSKIVRINEDGSLDTSFTIGTGFNFAVEAIALQPDGKIVVGGQFFKYNGEDRKYITRLNPDGSLDDSFSVGTGFGNSAYTIALQTDGKILVGGSFERYNGQSQNKIARLNIDGTLDTSVITGTRFNDEVSTIALDNNGKILAGGMFTTYNGQSRNHIARLQNTTLGTENVAVSDIKIYPNPVKNKLNFSKEIRKITIIDLAGKVLSTQTDANQTDMSKFPNGVYLLVMEHENGTKETRKVVKN